MIRRHRAGRAGVSVTSSNFDASSFRLGHLRDDDRQNSVHQRRGDSIPVDVLGEPDDAAKFAVSPFVSDHLHAVGRLRCVSVSGDGEVVFVPINLDVVRPEAGEVQPHFVAVVGFAEFRRDGRPRRLGLSVTGGGQQAVEEAIEFAAEVHGVGQLHSGFYRKRRVG